MAKGARSFRRWRIVPGLLGIGLAWFVFSHWHAERSLESLTGAWAQPPSQWVQLEGYRNKKGAPYAYPVHYRDEGSGPPLVLLHGTAASLHTWQAWTDTLAGRFRCIRMDLPGFGLTGPHPDRDYSIEAYMVFLERFMDALGLDSVALAGNSLGGEIAWRYAAAHPDRCRRLVLVDPAGLPREGSISLAFRVAHIPVLGALMTRISPRPLIRRSLEEVYTMDELVSDSLVDLYFEHLLRQGNRQAFRDRAKTEWVDQSHLLSDVRCPSLILWGSEDDWIPVEHGRTFEARMPEGELLVIPGAGHVPHEELPIPTANTTERYLCASGW